AADHGRRGPRRPHRGRLAPRRTRGERHRHRARRRRREPVVPTIIMTKWPVKLDGSVRAQAMTFLQKLSADDTIPGLHVEPIAHSADPRVRTGRVSQFWRAV